MWSSIQRHILPVKPQELTQQWTDSQPKNGITAYQNIFINKIDYQNNDLKSNLWMIRGCNPCCINKHNNSWEFRRALIIFHPKVDDFIEPLSHSSKQLIYQNLIKISNVSLIVYHISLQLIITLLINRLFD